MTSPLHFAWQQISLVLLEIVFHVRLAPWFLGILFRYHVLQRWMQREYGDVHLVSNAPYYTAGHGDDHTLVNDKSCTLDYYHYKGNVSKQVIVFVHGGAWKNGDKLFYYYLAHDLCRHFKRSVAVINYRKYPRVGIETQVTDVDRAIRFVKSHLRTNRLLLIGHSAGAHLIAYCLSIKYFGVPMTNIESIPLHQKSSTTTTTATTANDTHDVRTVQDWSLSDIDGWIGLSGVYDIAEHYAVECRRGVVKWSGMEGAMHGVPYFDMHSPAKFYTSIKRCELQKRGGVHLVNTLLLHGEMDETVPPIQSQRFHQALIEHFSDQDLDTDRTSATEGGKVQEMIQCTILPKMNHTDIVMALMEVSSRKHHRHSVIQQLEEAIERFSTP